MTMTTEPATDEEIAAWRKDCDAQIALGNRRDDFLTVHGTRRLIARIDKERERAEKAEATPARADFAHLSRLMRRARNGLIDVVDGLDDEGDRVYLASTNDADNLKALAAELDAARWHEIMAKGEAMPDLYAEMRARLARAVTAESERDTLRQEVERLREAATWTPTHRHYKGGLYRELFRGTNEADGNPVVVYQGENGRVWTRWAVVFDEKMPDGTPRFAALTKEPTP